MCACACACAGAGAGVVAKTIPEAEAVQMFGLRGSGPGRRASSNFRSRRRSGPRGGRRGCNSIGLGLPRPSILSNTWESVKRFLYTRAVRGARQPCGQKLARPKGIMPIWQLPPGLAIRVGRSTRGAGTAEIGPLAGGGPRPADLGGRPSLSVHDPGPLAGVAPSTCGPPTSAQHPAKKPRRVSDSIPGPLGARQATSERT